MPLHFTADQRRFMLIPTLAAATLAVAWLALPVWFVLVPPVLVLAMAALHSGVRAGFFQSSLPALVVVKLRYGLMLSLTQAGVYAVLFVWLMRYFLGFPNRDAALAALQVWAVIGLVFHVRYVRLAWRTGQLPRRVWTKHVFAIVVGGMLGALWVVVQTSGAQSLHQRQQQPLVDALSTAAEACDAFTQYLYQQPHWPKAPQLYHGAVGNLYGGKPQFVLAYRATADFESLIVYYYSGSRKWTVTYQNNPIGMRDFTEKITPLARCEVPGTR